MYILCNLDSEHYTDPEYRKFNSNTKLEDIRKYAVKDAREYIRDEMGRKSAEEGIYEWDKDGMRLDARVGDFFVVYEIKELPDADYIIGYYHAYNGVDFTVRTATSIDVAREIAKSEADILVDKMSVPLEDYDTDNINQRIVDDGCQWHVWSTYYMNTETSVKAVA